MVGQIHAGLVVGSGVVRERTFTIGRKSLIYLYFQPEGKFVSAGRRNQHSGQVRSPEALRATCFDCTLR
jgi:hypothetical protein